MDNNIEEMELFLEDCKDFGNDIVALSTYINEKNINRLDINNDILVIINAIKGMKVYRNNLSLSSEDMIKINKEFDKLKRDLVTLKNKHIHIYNEKVDYINNKFLYY